MPDQSLPAPSNRLTSVLNTIIDALIKGLGVNAAYALAVSQVPFLGLPIISSIFRYVLNQVADVFDTNLKINTDIIVIRFQNDARKASYDAAILPLKKPGATHAEIEAAKSAIDSIVSRSH